jgi:hypothetical protein
MRVWILLALLFSQSSTWSKTQLQFGLEEMEHHLINIKQNKVKKKLLELPIVLIAFKDTQDLDRSLKEINLFNKIFQTCSIQTIKKVPYITIDNHQYPAEFISGKTHLPWEDKDLELQKVWGNIEKSYAHLGIPIFYFNRSYNNGSLVGSTRNFRYIRPKNKKLMENFSPFAVYLTDISRSQVITKNRDYQFNLTSFSHELGHILFNESHHQKAQNLMASGKVRKGQKLSQKQCDKARRFIQQIDKYKAQFN